MNICEKMLAITNELQVVAKNLTVGTGKNNYKAVSERDVIDAVKPLEQKYGVYSYPVFRRVLESNILESESTFNGNTTKKSTFMARIETTYRFVNVENPGEDFIETTVFSEGIDPQDKGSGKAMTYADKYALMKMYKISTGEDPDQIASIAENYKKLDYRSELIKYAKSKNIDFKNLAVEYDLTGKSTQQEFKEALESLKEREVE